MINTNRLRGIFTENGDSQADVAKMLGITPKTFYIKMKKVSLGAMRYRK